MTPFALDLRKECAVSALAAEVLEEPKEPWMEMTCCKNCECEKTDHTDERHCLFAPMKFEAMTPQAYLEFLSRKMTELAGLQPPAPFKPNQLYPPGSPYTSPAFPDLSKHYDPAGFPTYNDNSTGPAPQFFEPSNVWNPYTSVKIANIVTSGSYTISNTTSLIGSIIT